MNYPPNTTQWKPGDLVIHDCDAKKPRMLMRVIGYAANGYCRTKYVDAELQSEWGRGEKSRLANPLKYLHDPALWGLELADPDSPVYDRNHSLKDALSEARP